MAIAFDAATDGGNNAGITTSLTFAHTCTGSNGFLDVCFSGDTIGGSDDVTGVTYNAATSLPAGMNPAARGMVLLAEPQALLGLGLAGRVLFGGRRTTS